MPMSGKPTQGVTPNWGTVLNGLIDSLYDELQKTEVILRWDGTGTQPLRSTVTSNTSRPVVWRQPTAPPSGNGYAIVGLDVWEQTS